MDLLERYLQAIRKYLPWNISRSRQNDILAELRTNLESQRDEREAELGRRLTEGELADWIRQLGSPIHVAARYQPVQFLIGPVLFPMYLHVLRLAALWALVAAIGVNLILAWTGVPNAGSVAEAVFVRGPGAVFTAATWVTLIFAILEYLRASHPQLLAQLDTLSTEWSPANLPPLEPAERSGCRPPTYARAVAQVIFGWLFLAWLLLVPKHPIIMFGPGAAYLHDGPFALAPAWLTSYWVVVSFHFGRTLWNTMDLTSGAWRRPSALRRLFIKGGGLVAIGVLLAGSDHVFAVLKDPAAADAGRYNALLGQVNPGIYVALKVVFAIVAAQFIWEIAKWARGRAARG